MVEIGQMAAVAGVLALLGLTLRVLRKRGFSGPLQSKKNVRSLECLERLSLGPHHSLHLVRMGDTSLLVASSPAGCSLLQSFPQSAAASMREGVR